MQLIRYKLPKLALKTNIQGMRCIILMSMCWLATSSHGQLLNGGFENWQEITFDHPVGPETTFFSSNFETVYQGGAPSVFQVSGFADSWMRIESTEVNGQAIGGYAIWGNIPEGDDLLFTDGFAFSDASASGIICDLNYEINPLSPGFMIVQFKFEGSPVGAGNIGQGTYLFPISGDETGFQQTEFVFNPPLPPNIDECVIGFASNNLVDDEAEVFVGNFIEVNNLAFIGSEQTIPGGDFEEWMPVEPYYVPDDWFTIDAFLTNLYERTEDAVSGLYAMKMNTVLLDNVVVESFIAQGQPTEDGFLPSVPVEEGFVGYSFQYKYEVLQDDMAFAIFFMSEEENPNPEDVIFWGTELPPSSEYALVTEDLSFIVESFAVNYVGIAFVSSFNGGKEGLTTPQVGSALYLDDVTLIYQQDPCDVAVEIEQGTQIMLCPDETLTLTLNGDFESYQWYKQGMFGGEAEAIENETESTLVVDAFNFSVFNVWCEVTFDECVVQSSTVGIDSWVFAPTVIASSVSSICEGESTELEAIGAAGTVTWFLNGQVIPNESDHVLVVSEPGTYTASIAPEVCPDVELFNGVGVPIVVHPNPNPIIEFDGVTMSVQDGFQSYLWQFQGETLPGEEGSSIVPSGNGVYTVFVTDENGCTGEASEVVLTTDELLSTRLKVYPNPVGDVLRIEGLSGWYAIYDLTGRMVDESYAVNKRQEVDCSRLAVGTYLLRSENGAVKFVKH